MFALVAAATAGIIQEPAGYYQHQSAPQYYQQPQLIKQLVQPTIVKQLVSAESPANYDFNYSVHDEHTGDIKQQQESAKNGVISGQYSLIDADGYRRIVDYTADDVHGFNAQVRREPLNQKVITKIVAPVHKVIAQPQYISAPTVTKVISQPQYLSSHANPALNPWG